MTTRTPVSTIFNKFHDAEQITVQDLDVEQNRNIVTDASIINNHFGSGVLPSSLVQNIIFDSDNLTQIQASILAAGNFDGTGLQAQLQPSDTNLGNQLEVELTGTSAFGRLSTKVLIIGVDFQGLPQYDRFTFHKSEKQVTRKHYARILGIFFNDFKGNNNCSRDLGGSIVIRESSSFELSRDAIMVAQDIEPNLFFRDFKVSNPAVSLYNTIQTGIGPEFSVDSLNINTTVKQNRSLAAGDVTSKIGEKFQAATNNIQKITLLLGAQANNAVPVANEFDWTGSLVISVWALQTTVSSPTDIVPQLAIDFDPSSHPLAQLSLSQADLKDLGYVLNDVLQPVDFVFSATQLGMITNSIIVPGNFYAVTINRSGAAGSGVVFTGAANHSTENARLTLFNNVWVDVPEEDLWFQVWTDAAKVADGMAYDAGNGIQLEKTEINADGAQVDFCLDALALSDSGENTLNIAIVQAIQQQSDQSQDERTGSPIFLRQQFEPQVSFVTNSGLVSLQSVSEPIIIGGAEDINPKTNFVIQKTQKLPGLAKGDVFTVVAPDPDLLSNNLIGSKLIPDVGCSIIDYRIFKTVVCTDGYGDVNGDGVIDALDVIRAAYLLGEGISNPSTQQKIIDGYISTLELLRCDVDGDGYITTNDLNLITQYVNRQIHAFPVGSSFTHMDITVQESIGRFDGYYDCGDGYVRIDGYNNKILESSLNPYVAIYDGYIVTPNIAASDVVFTTIPFVPIDYKIAPQPFWADYMLVTSSDAKVVPAAFSFPDSVVVKDCVPALLLNCRDTTDIVPKSDPGRNDIMIPDNLIMRKGAILNPDGTNYRLDFEVGQIVLNLPAVPLEEVSLNIFDKFVVEADAGFTIAGLPAMKFSDCTYVKSDALLKNQLRFDVSIQAWYPSIDGYSVTDGYGVIVDNTIGVYLDHNTGILTLTMQDLSVDPIFKTLVSKIQITVYIKKSGFVNQPTIIDSSQFVGLLS
jgi:hypothetical protein